MQDRITTKERGSTAMDSAMDRLTGLAKAKAGELLGGHEQGDGPAERPGVTRDGTIDDRHDERTRSKT